MTLFESRNPADFVLKEGDFYLSRYLVTIAGGSGLLGPGAVFGRVSDAATAEVTVKASPSSSRRPARALS